MDGFFARFAPVCGLALASLVAFWLLSACHARQEAGEPAAAINRIDPCALVTRGDAERILGARVKPAIRRKTVLMATGRECDYVTAAPVASAGGSWDIDLIVYDDATVATPDSLFKSATDYFRRDMAALRSSGTTLVAVPGLGESAFWQPGADLLHVLDHGVYVMLDVDADFHIPPEPGGQADRRLDSAKRAAEIALAQDTILPRLAHPPAPSTRRPPAGETGVHSS